MSTSSAIASSTKIKFIDPGNTLTTFISIDILIAIIFILGGLIFFVLGIYYYCKTKLHRIQQQRADQPFGLLARSPHVHSKHITIQRSNPNKIRLINTTQQSNNLQPKSIPITNSEKSPTIEIPPSSNPVAKPRPRIRPPPIPTTHVEVDADGILSDGELE